MKRLNNGGQSLVLFVLCIPLVLVIMVLVIDLGNVLTSKKELDNVSKLVLRYGLNNIEQNDIAEKMVNLFKLNIREGEVLIDITDNGVEISSFVYVKGIFSKIINVEGFEVVSNYRGSNLKDEIKIERIK